MMREKGVQFQISSKVTVNSHSTLYGRVVGGEVLINSFGSVDHDKSMSKRANNTSRLVQ